MPPVSDSGSVSQSERAGHTAGEWYVDHLEINNEVVVRADEGLAFICMVVGANKECDARLIAAAKNMLAALKLAEKEHKTQPHPTWTL